MFVLKIKKIIYCLFYPNFILSYLRNVCPLFELKEFISYIKNIDCLVDIGSNKGQFSLLFRYFHPKSKIYSFEPQKKYLDIQKKLLKNRIKFYNFCLGQKKKYGFLNITEKEDSSSILRPNILEKSIYKIKKKQKTKIDKLDNILDLSKHSNILIKIDVQGYEKQVLLGANKTLKKTKYIIIELTNTEVYKNQSKKNEIIQLLNEKKFKLIKISNFETLSKYSYIADYLFVNKNL